MNYPTEDFLRELFAGNLITGREFISPFDFSILSSEKEIITIPLIFENCSFKVLQAYFLTFQRTVQFKNCTFENLQWQSCHFMASFEFTGCTVLGESNFDCCDFSAPCRITNSVFEGFVNFFDNQFRAETEIIQNSFSAHTNLLGNSDKPFANLFSAQKSILDNIGELDKGKESTDNQ